MIASRPGRWPDVRDAIERYPILIDFPEATDREFRWEMNCWCRDNIENRLWYPPEADEPRWAMWRTRAAFRLEDDALMFILAFSDQFAALV